MTAGRSSGGRSLRHAHSLPGRSEDGWEPLSDHLVDVGAGAAAFAAPFGAEQVARAAGLLHDIGKCSAEYQAYIRDEGPSPDHSTAGAKEAIHRYRGGGQDIYGRLIAFAVAGHHAGLADGAGTGAASLDSRLNKTVPAYEGWKDEVVGLPETLSTGLKLKPGASHGYSLALLGRMLFSCLVDADFLATEKFYAKSRDEEAERGGHATLGTLRERLDRHLAALAGDATDTALNRLRAEILAHARDKASCDPGLFTMTVPTGGGKTLAGLAFALDHAIRHGLSRVIYVIPYTSIIEQTADIFRAVLGDKDVLEHHGNIDWERPPGGSVGAADDEGDDGWRKLRRASENWDVPVVVTTAVQFFESLHAARTSRCRKLHNLARSVVILDEAQTLPVPLLRPCMAAIDELAANYGASIVLCTATQPALKREQDGFRNGLTISDDRELAPDPDRLYEQLRRVTVEHRGAVTDAEIAARFGEAARMLCIVNSRSHAQALFALIADLPGARHLTTLMCPAHRRQVLKEVREELKAGRPARIVSTSLIEAGVDIDLPEVWRAETGLDSIAQAAGRCNREGAAEPGRVVVFAAADHKLPAIFRQQVDAMKEALRHHAGDPLGLDAVRRYFRTLYWQKGEAALDAAKLEGETYPILAALHASFNGRKLDTPYDSIARAFRMIDDVMDPVIVPWRGGGDPGEADRLLAELRGRAAHGGRPPGAILRKLQQFTVSIPSKSRAAMLTSGAVQAVAREYGDRFVRLEWAKLYGERTGLALDQFAGAGDAIFL